MKPQIFTFAIFLSFAIALNLPVNDENGSEITTSVSASVVHRDVVSDASADGDFPNVTTPTYRGTFTLQCTDQIADACNNLCFFKQCRHGPITLTKSGETRRHNSRLNGCSARYGAGGSVCSNYLFASKFNYPSHLTDPSCDEWPPATVEPLPGHAASLRCMQSQVNTEAGKLLGAFVGPVKKGNPPPMGRIGDGEIKAGQTFDYDFNIDNVQDKSQVPYCMENPDCTNDGLQFHLTKFTDHLSEDYAYDADNHYSLGSGGVDIRQCQVKVNRQYKYEYLVYTIGLHLVHGTGHGEDKFAELSETYKKGETFNITTPHLPDNFLVTPHGLEIDSPLKFQHDGLEWNVGSTFMTTKTKTANWCGPLAADGYQCHFPCRYIV